jgi:demethylmenaquinone methyltransferase/2-methoxy-6-polyprenyl-1,4-benzoquinol methylase
MTYLYRLSRLYGAFLRILGFERGVSRFIDRLELDCAQDCRILDLACGSGVMGLQLLKRFNRSTLVATDLERNFLEETRTNAKERGLDTGRITLGTADITEPRRVTLLTGEAMDLQDRTFDIVCIGGALGYSKDPERSVEMMLDLVKPGGYFINLEMNNNPVGKIIASLYDYRPVSFETMERIAGERGQTVKLVRTTLREFPANLTRIGVIARATSN